MSGLFHIGVYFDGSIGVLNILKHFHQAVRAVDIVVIAKHGCFFIDGLVKGKSEMGMLEAVCSMSIHVISEG